MKNNGLNNNEVWTLIDQVNFLTDEHLIDEVLHIGYSDFDHISDIVANFMKEGALSDEERFGLIGFYVLQWYDYNIGE